MNIPLCLRAGDTWEWTDSLGDYPATTYTLKYSLYRYGESVKTITAAAVGTDHAVSVAVSYSSAYQPGEWKWTAYVETGSGPTLERYTLEEGTISILPFIANATVANDYRTHAEKVLDAIEATLEGRASQAQASLSIGGKAISYMRPDELIRWRSIYRKEVAREKGKDTVVRVQFGRA